MKTTKSILDKETAKEIKKKYRRLFRGTVMWQEHESFLLEELATKKQQWQSEAVEGERQRILKAGAKEFTKMFHKTCKNIMLQQDFEEIVRDSKTKS